MNIISLSLGGEKKDNFVEQKLLGNVIAIADYWEWKGV